MNMKELEALVIALGKDRDTHTNLIAGLQVELREAREAHMHLVQRADNIVEGFKKELAARDERITTLSTMADNSAQQCALHEVQIEGLSVRIEKLESLVLARNASAPTKRNMTDEDALRVLTGDLCGLSHKDAAEKAGLTYAQVYSCRLEFTFKHVHKDLRDNVKEWANPWSK